MSSEEETNHILTALHVEGVVEVRKNCGVHHAKCVHFTDKFLRVYAAFRKREKEQMGAILASVLFMAKGGLEEEGLVDRALMVQTIMEETEK